MDRNAGKDIARAVHQRLNHPRPTQNWNQCCTPAPIVESNLDALRIWSAMKILYTHLIVPNAMPAQHVGRNCQEGQTQCFVHQAFANLQSRDVLIRHYQTCPSIRSNTTLSSKEPRRISRACRACHEMKLRCSGDPVCSRCVDGMECVAHQRRQSTQGRQDTAIPWPSPKTDHSNGSYDLST
jgi:hypothetical protein